MSKHQASFAKLGYLYQVRYALLKALEESDAYYIKLEALDDVEIDTSSEKQLLQLKHHVKKTNVSDKSPDLWKTLGIWCGQLLDQDIDTDEIKFYLITTSSINNNSAAFYIQKEKRDIRKAIENLNLAAQSIDNKAITTYVENYKKLTDAQKESLFARIFIVPNEGNADELTIKIKNRLELSVDPKFVEQLYEKLEGWWFNKVVEMLIQKTNKIWRDEVRTTVLSYSYDYHPDSLPIDFSDVSLEKDQIDSFMDHQFVKQLEIIGVGIERINLAILDYYKAFNQRTQWITEDLLVEYDISKYEGKLLDEWKRFKLAVIDELGENGENELKKAGRKIFNWAETKADIRIRPRVADKFIMTGSYHILSNKKPTIFGWHPKFEDRIKALLNMEESQSGTVS